MQCNPWKSLLWYLLSIHLQVAPSELEAILITHPEVIDVAVLGIPHEVFGELAQALVVLQDGANVGQGEIQDFLAGECDYLHLYLQLQVI